MDRFKITGVPPYDGEFDIDLTTFTNRELHTIKRISGNRGNEIREAFMRGDNDLVVALVIIALQRSGRFSYVVEDAIWDAPSTRFEFVEDVEAEQEQGDDADPPTIPAAPPEDGVRPSSPSESSGPSSDEHSETQASDPIPTGPLV